MTMTIRVLVAALWLGASARCVADDAPALARGARQVLATYCRKCHGINFKVPGLDVLDRRALVGDRGEGETPFVVPGRPEASLLWQMVGIDEEMPPKNQPQPSAAEKAILREWIRAGAPAPGDAGVPPSTTAGTAAEPVQQRRWLRDLDVLKGIRDYLRDLDEDERAFKRFFTLTVAYNQRQHDEMKVKPLSYYRAALSKVVNSLSMERDIVIPRAVDAAETTYVIDLRDLGWDQPDLWREVLKVYPYGLVPRRDAATLDLHNEVVKLSGNALPYLRADWFIVSGAMPPLYHTLLRIPATAGELERRLGVDVRANFLAGKTARAALANSNVSRQNRLVERHRTPHGAYWKSYDFANNDGDHDLLRRPLGPTFPDHPFPDSAFQHDGGEIIFTLPNGLQGYMLVNRKDERLNRAPAEIVEDKRATAGTEVIVNGLSCMGCHKQGTIAGFRDSARDSLPVGSDEARKLKQLHPAPESLEALLHRDRKRYLEALQEATAPFLEPAPGRALDRERNEPEVISAVTEDFLRDLGADAAAIELNLADLARWRATLEALAHRNDLGLNTLRQGASIARAKWQSNESSGVSLFQEIARELNYGTPRNVH